MKLKQKRKPQERAHQLQHKHEHQPSAEHLCGRKSLRRLLRSWHDPATLNAHPLIHTRAVTIRCQTHHEDELTALRRIVLDAVEQLRPANAPFKPTDRAWRPYLALTRHYLDGQPIEKVAQELCVEPVSCRRALQQAIDALGNLLRQAEEQASEHGTLIPTTAFGRIGEPVNMAPVVHGPFIGRRALLEQAESLLAFGCRRLALYGLPGSGKSTALAHLARSSYAQAHFTGGVFWANLGPQPDLLAILNEWGLALGLSQHDLDRLNVAQRTQVLRYALGTKRALFAFDDVWQLEHVIPLLIGNEHSAYLLATSSAELAASFADAHARLQVQELSLGESLHLLNALAPGLEAHWHEELEEAARACGGLPLALTLIGHYMRRESHAKQPRRIRAAFARLRERRARLTLRAPLSEPNGLATERRSLGETIALSVALLPPEAQRGLAGLCVLPAKPEAFHEDAALAVLRAVTGEHTAPAVLDRLVDAGLIESHAGVYRIHSAIVDWHAADASPDAVAIREAGRRALIGYVMGHLQSTDQCLLPAPDWSVALAAVQAAIELNDADAAAHFATVLFACLDRRGLQTLAEQLLAIAEAHPTAHDPVRRCRLDIQHGRALIRRGELSAAIQRLNQVITTAQHAAPDVLPEALVVLGEAHFQAGDAPQILDACDRVIALTESGQGMNWRLAALIGRTAALAQLARYDEAESTIVQTISLARELGNVLAESTATLNLGIMCRQRGRHADAVRYLEAALTLARQIDFRERIVNVLTVLGVIAVDEGEYARAERHYREALPLAYQINNLPGITLLEHAFGVLDMRQGKWDSAHEHLLQALTLADQHNFAWYRASVRVELGEWHLARGALEHAEKTFTDGLEIAGRHGYDDLAALNRFGLARIRAAQGDAATARDLATSALSALRACAHYRTDEVANWISALN